MIIIDIMSDSLTNPINLTIVLAIAILAIIDVVFKKDLKSQIVSLGVLGTFIGIFMGLQDFNPANMKDSINTILIGLKTAFFTSIVGMGVALFLSVLQRIFTVNLDDSTEQSKILLEISSKLDSLEKLDNADGNDRVIGELERLRTIEIDSRDIMKEVSIKLDSLERLKTVERDIVVLQGLIKEQTESWSRDSEALLFVLDGHFKKMNQSLEIAIEKLSKGATEEIINALKQVIEEFNQELQSQFGENFVKLNESVVNLLKWQDNYKTHIENIDNHLQLSNLSIEKSKDSFEIIASKNEDVLMIYAQLQEIIFTYDKQIEELGKHLKTYSNLSSSAENMFSSITNNISKTKDEFSSLTQHIKDENRKQINDTKRVNIEIEERVKELEQISKYFKDIGVQIPTALKVSLEALNSGLTSLTNSFQKDYEKIMDSYKDGIKR